MSESTSVTDQGGISGLLERRAHVFASALLLLFAAQAIHSMQQKSVTVDEITYFAAGYYHLSTGDFGYNRTNPPLTKMLVAAPLFALDLALPERTSPPSEWNAIEEWQYARRFLYENRTDADLILFVARLPIVALGIVAGILVFVWGSRLYGDRGGLVALFVYSFSPNMLAHTRLATQDMALVVICLGSTLLCWHYIRAPRRSLLPAIGVLLGLGAATKTTAVLLLPAWGVFWLLSIWREPTSCTDPSLPWVSRLLEAGRPRAAQLITVGLAGLILAIVADVTLAAVFGFSGFLNPIGDLLPAENILARFTEGSLLHCLAGIALATPTFLPDAYVEGLLYQSRLTASSGGLYFAGKTYSHSLWWLMLACLAIKTPIASLLCIGSAAAFALRDGMKRNGEWLLLAVAGIFLVIFSVVSNVGGGVRYVLPALPCLFILVGRLARAEANWAAPKKIVLSVLGAWYVGSAVWIHPNYLVYSNEFIGGPSNGWRYLADSNLDWGQDLKLLKRYMDERGIERIKLGYFGSADARYYGIDYDYLPSVGLVPNQPGEYWWYELDTDEKRSLAPQTGLVAISANLVSRPQWLGTLFEGTYDWLQDVEPIDTVGYSILIYDLK